MKFKILFPVLLTLWTNLLFSQAVGISATSFTPDASAILEVKATDKGVLIPRMSTAQRTTIGSPATGLLVFDTNTGAFWFYGSSGWTQIGGSYTAGTGISIAGNAITNTGDTNPADDLTSGSAAGGDLSGTYPNPDIAANAVGTTELANSSVTTAKISSSGAINGYVLTANGSGGANWLTPAFANKLQDADTDTKIQVEESPDEDIIRFDVGGTENMVLRKNTSGMARLELLNASGNTFVGENVGLANTTGSNNTAQGKDAFRSNTTGSGNSVQGKDALRSNTTGFSNVAVGIAALYNNTTGDNLVAVGDSTLYNSSGSNNTAVGSKALYTNTTGSQNTAVGMLALTSNTTGNDNVAVGRESMRFNTEGFNNTAIGEGSLRANTDGDNNTALGNTSLRSNTTGSSNTASGLQALYTNSSGSNNTANGFNALFSNTTASSNAALGSDALYSTSTGNNNTALGHGAGFNNSTGSGNVFIGKSAGAQETGSDKLYIDNTNTASPLIGGNFSTNRVGINTASPSATLHVEGSVTFSTGDFAFYANDGGSNCEQTGCASGSSDVSIFASNRIRASEFNAFSDARIKRITRRSNPAADLALLSGLQVTDYQYIDVVGKGAALKKGFIAQEVEQVFPEAINKCKDFVPNVYRMASAVRFDAGKRTLTVMLAGVEGLQPGDRVRLVSSSTFEKEVMAVTPTGFTVADWTEQDTKQVFVFGKEVEDFRNVDYDRIFTLNVSAVQELARRNSALEEKVIKMDLENAALRTGNEQRWQEQQQQIDALQSILMELKNERQVGQK